MPVPGQDEVLIKVEAVGICGSELEGYLGHSSVRVPPLIMGHEFCGVVVTPGSSSERLQAGDRVVVNPLIACGRCDRCLAGRLNICRQRQIIGIHRPGAFAEYVTVPRANVYRVPREMDPQLASLAEPLAVCIHALKLGPGLIEHLVVMGAGPIGLLTVQAALNMGVEKIVAVDRQPARLEYARNLGAIPATPEQLELIAGETFGSSGVDTIIDCVGVQATREQAMLLVNPGGTIVMVGLGQDQSALSMNHLVRQELSVLGSYTYSTSDFEQAVELLVKGKITADNWIASCELEEGPASFESLVEGRAAAGKIIMTL